MKGKCADCKVCKAYLKEIGSDQKRHVLSVRWRRNPAEMHGMDDQFGLSEGDIRSAVATLKELLAPSGVDVVLEIFRPVASGLNPNRDPDAGLWIGGRSIQEWRHLTNGQDGGPRRREKSEKERSAAAGFEPAPAITAETIIKAGVAAANKILEGERSGACNTAGD